MSWLASEYKHPEAVMAGPPANAARVGIAQARVSAACPLLGSLVPSLRGPDFCISWELSLPPCLVS